MANLPYDAEVEYLESTGTQWINSGIISENAVSYEVKFKLGPTYTGAGIFGSLVQNSETTNNRVLRYNAGNTIIVQRGNYSTSNSIPIDYNWHTVSSSSSQLAIDSTTFSSGNCTNGGAIIALFASGDVGTALGQGSVLISYARIWTSNTLVRDFIPVRFTNENGISEGAMYDKVTGQLFRNAGTGSFIIGPDVVKRKLCLGKVEVPELPSKGGVWLGKKPVKQVWLGKNLVWERLPYDAEVEYLESTGATTYMLLPLVWSSTSHVEVTWQRINRAGQWLFGCRTSNNNTVHVALHHERNNDNLSRARFQNYTHTTYGDWWSGTAIQQREETVTIDYPTLTMTYSLGTKTISAFEATLRNNTTALFGIGNSTGTGLYGSSQVRIFSFKASDATGGLYDLQPVRLTNELGQTEGAMYDKMTKQLFRNQGTGSFVIGPDKT